MEIIQSKDNSLIKEVKKLKEKRFRMDKSQFLIEGFRFVEEALKSSYKVPLIFLSDEALSKFNSFDIVNKLQKETKVYMVKESILQLLSSTETPQGIVAVVNNTEVNIVDKEGFYILVDRVQDPGNMGTIIRTAHAAGAIGVVVTKGTVDVYNEKTLRSTMGSIFNIPVIEDKNLSLVGLLREKGFKLIVSSLDRSENFYDVDLTGKIIIAVGNEGGGISEELYDMGDLRVKIPMPGNAESLNVSVAASIMMFEAVRQKLTTRF